MNIEKLIQEKIESIQLPDKFIMKIKHDLEYIFSYGLEDLEQIILFGSCARGKVKATSDVDWLIVTREPIVDRNIRHTILCDLCDEYNGVEADVVFTTLKQRDERNTSFMKLTESDELIIWEKGDQTNDKE